MNTNTMPRKGDNLPESSVVYCVDLDVHEMPALMDLPVPEHNQGVRRRLDNAWSEGRPFNFGDIEDRSLGGVRRHFDEGWPDGGRKATGLAEGLIEHVSQPLSIRRRVRWSDDGDEFEKERLYDGHLDACWRTTTRSVAVATPIINILVSWGGNAWATHEQLFWAGASAIALVQVLEEAGYQTNLTAICPTYDNYSGVPNLLATVCRVKQAGEYIRPDAVASVLCLGATFRTYGFASITSAPFEVGDGLGTHADVAALTQPCVEMGVMNPPEVVLHSVYDEESARESIRNALSDLRDANLAALPEEVLRDE